MILDATASYREIWFNKNHEDTIYFDKRKSVNPTVVGDFQQLPFRNESFSLVVFDPPHTNPGETGKGIFYKTYGALRASKITPVLYRAARELFRVLKEKCFLIFKWNTHSRNLRTILPLFPLKPLFGQRSAYKTRHSSSTYWVTFQKSRVESAQP